MYQEQILAFAKAARSQGPVARPDHSATVSNPTCGDRVEITFTVKQDKITSAGAAIRGCALCEAGAGLLLGTVIDSPRDDLPQMRDSFAAWLAGDDTAPIHEEMKKFMPVRTIRNRHKCVLLAFEAAAEAVR